MAFLATSLPTPKKAIQTRRKDPKTKLKMEAAHPRRLTGPFEGEGESLAGFPRVGGDAGGACWRASEAGTRAGADVGSRPCGEGGRRVKRGGSGPSDNAPVPW